MNLEANEVLINGVAYVQKSAVAQNQRAEQFDGLDYVIVRTTSAGVFAGYLESKEEKNVVLRNARRLWYWVGAASLSQLAVSGTSRPSECKFPCEVPRVELTEAIEILNVTAAGKNSISEVKIWQA